MVGGRAAVSVSHESRRRHDAALPNQAPHPPGRYSHAGRWPASLDLSESVVADRPVRHHRSLFLSDLHLGALGSRADLVLDFLKFHLAESYLLVGDIVDLGTPLLSRWSADHQAVIDFLRKRQDAGARITYVRGNHDPAPEDVQLDRRLPVPWSTAPCMSRRTGAAISSFMVTRPTCGCCARTC